MSGKKMSGKMAIALLVAVALMVGGGIGGTMAWLIAGTKTVTNTFTAGDVSIDLKETIDGKTVSVKDQAAENTGFKMVPGVDMTKNPMVEVKTGSEACWLFVKVEEKFTPVTVGGTTYSFDKFLDYDMYDVWTEVDGVPGVYFINVPAATAASGTTYSVIKDNKVHVPSDVTKEMLNAVEDNNKPQLILSAYAIQSEGLKDASDNEVTDAAAAWALIGK